MGSDMFIELVTEHSKKKRMCLVKRTDSNT